MAVQLSPPRRRSTMGYGWLAFSAVAVVLVAVPRYLLVPLTELAADDTGIAGNYVDRATALKGVFYVHVVVGGLALLLSPLQLSARLRQRRPGVHRGVGRVVLAAVLVAGVAGAVLAPFSRAGAVGTVGFGALAVLWVACAASAFLAIRRRDVAEHRRWAVRTFALTYAAVTLRLWLGLLVPLQVALWGVDPVVAFDRAYHLVPFLAWVPNLVVAEYLLRRRSSGPAAAGSPRSSRRWPAGLRQR